ncbi:MAG: hypothetical protein ACK43M_12095 [Allorhizobium sp.]
MLIRTYADIEKLQGKDALSEAERLLLSNSRSGTLTILGDGSRPDGPSVERSIRAGILRYLVLGGCESHRVHERGVRLGGGWIWGELDLRYAQAASALNLTQCGFSSPIDARQAHFKFLQLNGSRLPGINMECVSIIGSAMLNDIECNGTISFSGASIGSQFCCIGAFIDGGGAVALNLQGAVVGDNLILDRSQIFGGVTVAGSRIAGQLSCKQTSMSGGRNISLNAQQAQVRAGVLFVGLVSVGEVSLSSAEIGGNLQLHGASINSSTRALDVEGASIAGAVFFNNASFGSLVSLSATRIKESCSFDGAILSPVSGPALNAQGLVVEGELYWRKIAKVGGRVELTSARLRQIVDDKESWDLVRDTSFVGATYDAIIGPLDVQFRMPWLRKVSRLNGQFHPPTLPATRQILPRNRPSPRGPGNLNREGKGTAQGSEVRHFRHALGFGRQRCCRLRLQALALSPLARRYGCRHDGHGSTHLERR